MQIDTITEKEQQELDANRLAYDAVSRDCRNIYLERNKKYRNSFSRTFQKRGIETAVTRIEDKFNRFETLAAGVADDNPIESIEDTLIDLANYAKMTIIELRKQKGKA